MRALRLTGSLLLRSTNEARLVLRRLFPPSLRRVLADVGLGLLGGCVGSSVGWVLFPVVLIIVVLLGLVVGWIMTIGGPPGYLAVAQAVPMPWYWCGLLSLAVVSSMAGALAMVGGYASPLARCVAGSLTWLAAVPGWWFFSRFPLSWNSGPWASMAPNPLDAVALMICAVALWWGMRLVRPERAVEEATAADV